METKGYTAKILLRKKFSTGNKQQILTLNTQKQIFMRLKQQILGMSNGWNFVVSSDSVKANGFG